MLPWGETESKFAPSYIAGENRDLLQRLRVYEGIPSKKKLAEMLELQ